ncbi:MAG: HNH endonuclease signature motif containing protein [Verrucomicrobiota bacterium]
MAYTKEQLDWIYRRTSGYCHLCQTKLSRKNYGRQGQRGAWHVDHSVPRSKGGTDHLNNLKAACIDCNLDKSSKTTRTARRWNGKTSAPLSLERRRQAKTDNGILGAVGGGAVGFAVAGPVGAVIGALAGGHLGVSANPDK